jgi:hypothetical protein
MLCLRKSTHAPTRSKRKGKSSLADVTARLGQGYCRGGVLAAVVTRA